MGLPVPSKTRPSSSSERPRVMGLPRKLVPVCLRSMPLVPSKNLEHHALAVYQDNAAVAAAAVAEGYLGQLVVGDSP